ncbi:hypothetical protein [Sediminicoccus rosea]|uniref:Uncharacterized protein n=1 Tax=Sediminicoccus rosea TaxID=1225128 RepID=A0ABZ0PDU7_9PROT|nr:hypothetical protein [Sediminicoccus rosea]WPB83880.1 hypothetical protein R9Z33_17400 [Sediminicoccus rosea]
MPGFENSAATLAKARQALAEAEAAARDARARLRMAERGAGDGEVPRSLRRADKASLGRMEKAREELRTAEAAFAAFSDPRKAVGAMPDSDPLLLLPLRLETRFGSGPRGDPQLWVRVYPDSCLVDAFQPGLSATELAGAKTYWTERWCAAGSEARHRAAWRALVASHGAGRARHIVASYAPLNPADEPKAAEVEVVLVIPVQAMPAEAQEISGFWKAMWHAGSDAAQQQAAFDALAARLGEAVAAEVVQTHVPHRFADFGPEGGARRWAGVVFLQWPEDPPAAPASWNAAAVADPLPERFVLVLSRAGTRREVLGEPVAHPLHVGFDAGGLLGGTPVADGAALNFPEETAWLADFDTAVKLGMGFRVDLSAEEAREGFDRLYVIGVCATPDPAEGAARLARFVTHRLHSNADFALVPHGTPTNNTEEGDSGFARRADPDRVFDAVMGEGLFAPTADASQKRDGQVLAEALGLDPALAARLLNADGQDQAVARAMRAALWPGTIGYFLGTLLSPVVGRATIGEVRRHFIAHVAGGGRLPAIRIGRQPYGVLPVTAFDRIAWLKRDGRRGREDILARMHPLLDEMRLRWRAYADGVAQVGAPGDAGQALLDVLGLHPASAEFHFRYAQADRQLANLFRLVSIAWTDLPEPEELKRAVVDFLAALGAAPAEVPQIARLMLQGPQGVLDGGTVASEPLQPGFETEHQRYIAWLAEAAERSVEMVRDQTTLPDGRVPHALLYILLRHALLLGYSDAAVAMRLRSRDFTEDAARAALREEALPHITAKRAFPVESRWESLFEPAPDVTGEPLQPMAEFLAKELGRSKETQDLAEQIAALRLMSGASQGQADRALRHHLDSCSHRLDAWLLGIPNAQLARMKRRGIHLGAYGWLQDVRPRARRLSPAELSDAEAKLLDPQGTLPELLADTANGGLVHAPSLDHAVTAAILRSAYMSAESDAERAAVGVNLSSERVRAGLALMDGMRTGQSLAALLGYRFERALHDRWAEAETDDFLLELRRAFPLVAGGLPETAAPVADQGKEAARNVVDGLKLLAQMRASGQRDYPFGLGATLPVATAEEARVISEEAQRLEELHDALGDLALAESVHQSVQGNFDRAAAALDAFAKGEPAPEPEVVRTPASGIALTLRLAVHLKEEVAPAAGATPRALAEPELDEWLCRVLPPLGQIGCRVRWLDPVDGSAKDAWVTLAELGLAPLDLVHLWRSEELEGAFAALSTLVAEHVLTTEPARFRPDAKLAIAFAEGPAGGISLLEAGALLRPVAALLKSARPLRPTDLIPENATTLADAQAVTEEGASLAAPLARLVALGDAARLLATDCAAALEDPAPRLGGALMGIDALIGTAAGHLIEAGRFGIAQSSPDRVRDMQRRLLDMVMTQARSLLEGWTARLVRCDAALARLAAAPAGAADAILREADLELPAKLPAAGADTAALEAEVRARRLAFAALTDRLRAVTTARAGAIGVAATALDAILDDTRFPTGDVTTEKLRAEAAAGVTEVQALARTLADVAGRRARAAAERLAEAATAPDAARRAELTAAAAEALFGEGFLHLPRFALAGPPLASFERALATAQSGETLEHLTMTAGIPLPVEEWLHGVARVRPAAQELEAAMLYGEALGVAEIALAPVQLPYRAKDSWLGLEFPEDYDLDGTRLLHTVHLAAPPDGSGRFKGLVLDEWTEVLPGARRAPDTKVEDLHKQASGVAFHFDRPNAEAPQSFLLVTPATADGTWHWEDIVGALDSSWELMRIRAVEPEHLDDPVLGQMLPATYMAAAPRDVTISAVLAANVGVARFMKVPP